MNDLNTRERKLKETINAADCFARPKINVLLLDDEKKFIKHANNELSKYGILVTGVTSFTEFLALINDQYDGFILDLAMKEFSGYEVLTAIREMGFRQPVLICSGYSMSLESQRRLIDMGANGIVSKAEPNLFNSILGFFGREIQVKINEREIRVTGQKIKQLIYLWQSNSGKCPQEIRGDLEFHFSQLGSVEIKDESYKKVIQSSLGSIGRILESASGNFMGSAVLKLVESMLSK